MRDWLKVLLRRASRASPFVTKLGAKAGLAPLDRALAMQGDDPEALNRLSRQLNNVFLKHRTITVTPDEVIARLPQASAAMRDVLDEFLVQLVFHRHAAELAGPLRGRDLDDLAARRDELGRAARHLTAGEGVAGPLFVAGVHYLRQEYVSAYDAFDAARRRLLAGRPIRHHNRGLLSMRPVETFRGWLEAGREPSLPAVEFTSDRLFTDDRPVVVAGLDGGYLTRYGQRLIESTSGKCNLHIHVVNSGQADLREAAHVRYSVEVAPDANSAYYATTRFLRLPLLLGRYSRPVMTVDADAFFSGSPQPGFDRLRGRDILMTAQPGLGGRRRYLAAIPWRRVMAGILYAAPTAGAQDFLDGFGALYAGLVDDRPPHWWIDQALLSATSDMLRLSGGRASVEQVWLHADSGMTQEKLG